MPHPVALHTVARLLIVGRPRLLSIPQDLNWRGESSPALIHPGLAWYRPHRTCNRPKRLLRADVNQRQKSFLGDNYSHALQRKRFNHKSLSYFHHGVGSGEFEVLDGEGCLDTERTMEE
ncbi:hypothetical protein CIHG_01687 [Coccidioides immitis H538.4]|nr:hypothetical protein CIRG_06016 [Coccidioides immitis RMSCC 2394]KMU80462.1 hypothetical protein CISG_02313 [Coccidioides immitis RMSCC 3703]KMU83903.1 hypothetical protein CIHG_01687 [Coccidioides immitis H538.4]